MYPMKLSLILIAFLLTGLIFQLSALANQNVGGDFGKSWLQLHGDTSDATEKTPNLWSWGNAPKGYTIYNGKPIPPGSGPQWYYPNLQNNDTPLITNATYLDSIYQDPWILAQFIGRPVMTVNTSAGPLF